MDEIDDPAVIFRGWWLYAPSVPDELRADLHRHGHVMLQPSEATAYQDEYQALIAARRAWLKQQGYR